MSLASRILFVGLIVVAYGLTSYNSSGADYTFSNTNYIFLDESDVNPLTVASNYPSSITVSNLTGQTITHVTVTLNGFSHTFPSDASVLLVGPTGQMAMLMSESGGQDADLVTNLTISFDDNSPIPLPILDPLFSFTFQPGAFQTPLPFSFPSPAPAGNSNAVTALSVFDNTDPDGTWSLFVVDDGQDDFGSIAGGWSMDISVGVPLQIVPAGTNLVFSWPVVTNQSFNLQTTLALGNPNAWSNAPGVPAQINGRNVVTNANANKLNATRYYRLSGS